MTLYGFQRLSCNNTMFVYSQMSRGCRVGLPSGQHGSGPALSVSANVSLSQRLDIKARDQMQC